MPELLDTFRALVLKMVPVDYLAFHPCTVRSQASDGTIEVVPDNQRIPAVAGVPIRTPFPDTTITVAAGARVLLGFEGADPKAPYAVAWSGSGLTSVSIGGNDLTEFKIGNGAYVALAGLVDARLNELKDAIANAAVLANDGGATFKTNILLALEPPAVSESWPGNMAATKVKAE